MPKGVYQRKIVPLGKYLKDRIRKNGDCWQWVGIVGNHGYGFVCREGRFFLAHRFCYAFYRGPIPNGLTLDHLCRFRACVNPDHLEPVTIKENVLRGNSMPAINKRKTHCKNGHEFSFENTYIKPDKKGPQRACRKCKRNWEKKYAEEKAGFSTR